MKAMVLSRIVDLSQEGVLPLDPVEMAVPEPGPGEILIRINACGVCHTELDEIEGRTPPPKFPVIPGHQVVGRVAKAAGSFREGDRVGVAWIFSACGKCPQCAAGNENLCAEFRATGRDADGGYAENMTAPIEFAHRIPDTFTDSEAAPLLCAGAIGYRSLQLAGIKDGQNLGLTGFGASAHLVLKMAGYRYPKSPVFVFARSDTERAFARELGAAWAGDTEEGPPEKLHSIIDTTPAWKPIIEALGCLHPGGRLVVNAIRKEARDQNELLNLNYAEHLWMEKEIKSVANVTRNDVREFLELAAALPIKPAVEEYSLADANVALLELKARKIRGAKVLRIA